MPTLEDAFPTVREALVEHFGGPRPASSGEAPFEAMIGVLLDRELGGARAPAALEALEQAGLLSPDATGPGRRARDPRRACCENGVPASPRADRAAFETWPDGSSSITAAGSNLLFNPDRSTDWLRGELAAIRGIGLAAADAILLFALKRPSYPVDRATFRVLVRHGWLDPERLLRRSPRSAGRPGHSTQGDVPDGEAANRLIELVAGDGAARPPILPRGGAAVRPMPARSAFARGRPARSRWINPGAARPDRLATRAPTISSSARCPRGCTKSSCPRSSAISARSRKCSKTSSTRTRSGPCRSSRSRSNSAAGNRASLTRKPGSRRSASLRAGIRSTRWTVAIFRREGPVDERVLVIRFIFHNPSEPADSRTDFLASSLEVVNYLVAHRLAEELGVEEEIWFLEYHQPQLAIWRKDAGAATTGAGDRRACEMMRSCSTTTDNGPLTTDQ